MKLFAISDLHLNHEENRSALANMAYRPDDWLIVAGDIGERVDRLRLALEALAPRFARVFWTPGNHDLWCPPDDPDRTRGQARYDELVAVCHEYNVVTPEDPFVVWPDEPDTVIVPMFLLYDYSFRPAGVPPDRAVEWARDAGILCGDERLLQPDPWPSRMAWCEMRVAATETRLDQLPAESRTILVNHWPLRYDLARPPRIPRFSIWCGTTRTEDWARRYRARCVVSGHLHLRTTLWRHGVRCEEVSLGYPRDWRQDRGIDWYLRQILPVPKESEMRFVPGRDPFG